MARADEAKMVQMAVHIHAGDNPSTAARKAGYAESVVRARAAKMARSERVKMMLLELNAGLKPGELGALAKARVHEKLIKLPKGKEAIGWVRTAAEMDGVIGGPSELHLHNETLSPVAARMVAEMVLKLQAERDNLEVPIAEIVSEGASGESQGQEDDDGVQIGELTHGFQDRTIG